MTTLKRLVEELPLTWLGAILVGTLLAVLAGGVGLLLGMFA